MEIPKEFHSMELSKPIQLEGLLESDNDGISLTGVLTAQVKARCDRCMCDCIYDIKSEVTEEFGLLVDQLMIDFDPIVTEYLLTSLPMKSLCKEECLGICSECGKDLNINSCDCDTDALDPRLEKLGLIFEDVEQDESNKEV